MAQGGARHRVRRARRPVRERMPLSFLITPDLAADHRARLHADVAGAARLRPAGGGDADAAAGRHGARQPSRHAARRQLRDDRHAVPRPGGGARARRCSTRRWWRPWTRAPGSTPPARSSTRCSASPAPRWPATTACRPSPRASARRPTSRTCRPPGRRRTAALLVALADPDVLVGPGPARRRHHPVPRADRPGRRDDPQRPPGADRHPGARRPLARRGPRQGRAVRLVPRRALHAARRPQRRVAPQRLRRAGQLGRVAGGGVAEHRRRRPRARRADPGRRRSRCRTATTRRRPSRRCSAAPTPPPDAPRRLPRPALASDGASESVLHRSGDAIRIGSSILSTNSASAVRHDYASIVGRRLRVTAYRVRVVAGPGRRSRARRRVRGSLEPRG